MKILLADDDRVSRRLLQVLLERWGHETVMAADGLEALEILDGPEPPMLILLDWEMPGLDGLEVCRRIGEEERASPPYIIFVTAKDAMVDMVRGLDAGAADFIRKPFNREELRARIRVGVRTLELQAELMEARRQMEELAMHDPLTEIFNRRALWDLLYKEVARCHRESAGLSVAVLDLDRFKQINDHHGHEGGDRILKEFVETAQACIRESDTLGRWGGEEFLLVAPHSVPRSENSGLNPLFERLRKAVEERRILLDGKVVSLTVSIGVAQLQAGEPVEHLVRRDDEALYQAKESGRNRCLLASVAGVAPAKPVDATETTP